MSQFKIELDGVELTDEPSGLDRFTSRLFRDESIKGLFITYPVDLTFYGDGYDAIVTKFDTEGYCSEMTVTLQVECNGVFTQAWQGIIFLRTLELNRTECTAKVSVQDDTYSARVFNNQNIPVGVRAARSKNGTAISPTTQIGLKFFNTIAGVNIFDDGGGQAGFTNTGVRSGFDIMAVMTHLIEFITDEQVSVRSDWYDNLDDTERYAIVLGKELRLGNGHTSLIWFENDFKTLYEFLQRTYNLFMTFENDGGDLYIRIEDQPYFEKAEPVVTFDNVDGVIESIKEILLYSSVSFGGKSAINDFDDVLTPEADFPVIDLLGFKEEQYFLTGLCNVDNELDLTHDFIVDSNVIFDVLNNADPDYTEYDEELFVVQYSIAIPTSPYKTYAFAPLAPLSGSTTLFIYNHKLLNSEIIQRHRLHGDLAKNISTDDRVKAINTAELEFPTPSVVGGEYEPIRFDDDYHNGTDPSNNYGNGTPQGTLVLQSDCRYTAPSSGIYSFTLDLDLQIVVNGVLASVNPEFLGTPQYYRVFFGFRRYDSIGGLKDEVEEPLRFFLLDGDGNRATDANGEARITDNLVWFFNETPMPWQSIGVQSRFFERTKGWNMYCEAGDYVQMFYRYEQNINNGIKIIHKQGNALITTATVTAGGLFEPGRPDEYFTSLLTFEKEVTREQISTLLSNAPRAIEVNGIRAYIDEVSLRHYDTFGEFQLITNLVNKG